MGSKGVREALLPALLASLLAAVLLAPAAAAQGLPEGEPIYTTQRGQGYEVYADGSLNIGGDVLGSCDTVLQEVQQTRAEPTREIYMQIEVCEDAGFPVPGSESLPETGGHPCWPLWRCCSRAGPSSPSAFAGSASAAPPSRATAGRGSGSPERAPWAGRTLPPENSGRVSKA